MKPKAILEGSIILFFLAAVIAGAAGAYNLLNTLDSRIERVANSLNLKGDKGKNGDEGSIGLTGLQGPPGEFPVGTIISSMLKPEDFQINLTPGIWVPADGRPYQDSQYFKLTGELTVPDLRGMFVRGLNLFEEGFAKPASEPKDTDDSRKAGKLQLDTTRNPRINGFQIAIGGDHSHTTSGESNPHTHTASTTARTEGGPNTFGDGNERGMKPHGSTNIGNNTAGHSHNIPISGAHQHTLTGGDSETRPINVAVYFYIKIN